MLESILESIKKMLGLPNADTDFDQDIIIHINSVIMILRQLGVGPAGGFMVTGKSQTWANYLGNVKQDRFAAVKSYIFLKVRQLFDPAASGAVTESTNNLIKELEFRLNVEAETPTYGE